MIKKLELGEFDAVLNSECFAKELDMISAFNDLNNCWKILAEKFAESLTIEEHVQRCFLNIFYPVFIYVVGYVLQIVAAFEYNFFNLKLSKCNSF